MATPSTYAIELRDKDFNLKERLEPYVTALSWEWLRVGGCGKANIIVSGDYLRFKASSDDEVRIYLPNETSGATLWYRGYVESVKPILSGNKQSIRIECNGYFGWAERLIVHNSGSPKTYNGTEVSQIVDDIVDTFIVANSSITKGTIDESNFTPDQISFKVNAKDSLRTLYDLLGTVEYGVDENLSFFWRNQSDTLAHKFYIGDKVSVLEDTVDFVNIVNKIYFEGGSVGGTTFFTSGGSSSSQTKFGLREAIISNGSVSTQGVASQYITGQLRQFGRPIRQTRVQLINTNKRLESTLPIGSVSIVDADDTSFGAIYGTTGNGGSNKLYGTTLNGGSNQVYGSVRKQQIDRISYTVSPMDGRVNATLQFGSSIGKSRASAHLKRIDSINNALRQKTL